MIEVDHSNSFVLSFRTAAFDRTTAQSGMEDGVYDLGKGITLFGVEMIGLTSCGASFVPGPHEIITIPVCILDLIGIGFTSIDLANDAESAVNDLIDFYSRSIDAGYNFCRMEGKSDEECR